MLIADVYRNRKGITESDILTVFNFAKDTIQRISVVAFSPSDESDYVFNVVPPTEEIRIVTYGKYATEAVQKMTDMSFIKYEYANLTHPDIYKRENIFCIFDLTKESLYAVADILIHLTIFDWILKDLRDNWYLGAIDNIDRLNRLKLKSEMDERQKRFEEVFETIMTSKANTINATLKQQYDRLKEKIEAYQMDILQYELEAEQIAAKLYLDATVGENLEETYKQMARTIAHMKTITDIEKYSSSRIHISVRTPMSQLDKKAFEQLQTSVRRNPYNQAEEWLQKLIEDFVNNKCKLWISQQVYIDLLHNRIGYVATKENGIANPHHKNYNCWGDYNRIFQDMQDANDYEGLITMIVTASAGINLYDVPVLQAFLSDLKAAKSFNTMCIEYKGSLMNISDYIRTRTREDSEDEIM